MTNKPDPVSAKWFEKLPVRIQAMQLTKGCDLDAICEFMGGEEKRNIKFSINYKHFTVNISTLEGMMHAFPGDWIIRGVKGEFYPCKPDIFAATYKPVECPTQSGVTLTEEQMRKVAEEIAHNCEWGGLGEMSTDALVKWVLAILQKGEKL